MLSHRLRRHSRSQIPQISILFRYQKCQYAVLFFIFQTNLTIILANRCTPSVHELMAPGLSISVRVGFTSPRYDATMSIPMQQSLAGRQA